MNEQNTIHLLQLYSNDMNVYGDWGNILVLKRRLEWHGYRVLLTEYNPGDKFPDNVDIVVGGGGQDSGQDKIQTDLMKIAPKLISLAENGTPMLLICGLYQMFGRMFKTSDGRIIKGIGLFDIETYAGSERLIGNIITHSDKFGDIIGYENHSGQTFLGKSAKPLGYIIKGAGNNGKDNTEGAIYKNVIGSYLHGSLLPKNPAIADFIIETATTKKFGDFTPTVVDDRFAQQAREHAIKRPR